jgi:hypothetical protein
MEWILGLLIIVLGGAAIFVIYLGERISVFETLLGIHPKITTDKLAEHVNFGPNPFGELSGENLWKAMTGETIEDSNIEVGDVDALRGRYEFILTRHIEALVEEGRFDAKNQERSPAKPTLRIPMLRGSVESFIPFVEASTLYEFGQNVETKPEKRDVLAKELDELIGEIFNQAGLELKISLASSLMPMSIGNSNINAQIDPDEDAPEVTEGETTLALPPGDSSVNPEKSDPES